MGECHFSEARASGHGAGGTWRTPQALDLTKIEGARARVDRATGRSLGRLSVLGETPAVFFFFSKVLDLAFSPLVWALALALSAAFAMRRGRAKRGSSFALASFVVLYAFSIGPTANALTRSLEEVVEPRARPDVHYDVLIVLGGMLDHAASRRSGAIEYNEAPERLHVALDWLNERRADFVLLSGGAARPGEEDFLEARVLREQLVRWGVDPARILVEDASLNTRDNAVYSAAIVRERGFSKVAMATSAFHMKRAKGCFNAVGLAVDTVAVDHRGAAGGEWLPRAHALAESTAALREHAGRLVYALRGYAASELVIRSS